MHAKQQAEKHGIRAEFLVRLWYHCCGYRLLRHRYRCHYGEVDLIMARGATVVFIEVKFRAANKQNLANGQNFKGQSLESILPNTAQQQRIRRAATYFLARHSTPPRSCRIDCVVLLGWFRWHFFKDAFF